MKDTALFYTNEKVVAGYGNISGWNVTIKSQPNKNFALFLFIIFMLFMGARLGYSNL